MKREARETCPIYMHVNDLESILPIEVIIPRCAAVGYDGIELRGWDITEHRQVADYLAYVHGLTQQDGLRATFGCRNDTVNPDAGVRAAAMADFKTIISFNPNHHRIPVGSHSYIINLNFSNFHTNYLL